MITLRAPLVAWRPTPATLGRRLASLTDVPSTCPHVGCSSGGAVPPGWSRLDEVTVVGSGQAAAERLGTALLHWDLHREARMVLAVSDPVVRPGTTVVNAAPLRVRRSSGPLAVLAPCRVVAVEEEPGRHAISYATLPGHPLVGEEQFTVERGEDGLVRLRIRSASRPVGLAALAPAAARAGQRMVNRRYAAAARRLAA